MQLDYRCYSARGSHGAASFHCVVYDRDRPRMPKNPRPELHYTIVANLGAFRTIDAAELAGKRAIGVGNV
jgi:hypothetical protein